MLGEREKLRAEPAATTTEAGQSDGLADIDAKLKAIRALRSSDPKLYWGDKTQAEEASLLAAREVAKSTAAADAHLRSVADAVLAGTDESFESTFNSAYDGLSVEGQQVVRTTLSKPALEAARPASESQLDTFRKHGPEAAAVLDAWGKKAGIRYATAEARLDQMLSAMSEADTDRAEAWFKGLPPSGRAAVVKALTER